MTIRLTPIQESIVRQAIKDGKVETAEEFITVALQQMQRDLETNLEQRLGMPIDDINRELDKGLSGDAVAWEGSAQFHDKMVKKHRTVSRGGSSK